MDTIRFGVVGYGNMGTHHARYFSEGKVENATLGAVCDLDPARLEIAKKYNVPLFLNHREMLASGTVDAILVATPHYDHPPIAMEAFEKKIHVLIEKPAAVSVKAARDMNEAAKRHPEVKFGIMFNQRTTPLYQKLRELIADGELGEIRRVTWLITDWFRTWSYYASGGWRATWAGEGGGVLINQCPHNLDLIQWTTGMMPSRVTAVGFIGKTHPIEVEDEMTAILEYPNGAIGHFITSTGEAPGTNRFEVCGDRGKIVAEGGKLMFHRARKNVQEINQTSPDSFVHVEMWPIDIPLGHGPQDQHRAISQNFVNAILKGTPLLSPGEEGVRGLELGNAMMMAGLTRQPVDLPLAGEKYDDFIKDMIKKHGGKKALSTKAKTQASMAETFGA